MLNLAAGAGSLQDVIKIFWTLPQHRLDTVYIGISMSEGYSGTLLNTCSAALDVTEFASLYHQQSSRWKHNADPEVEVVQTTGGSAEPAFFAGKNSGSMNWPEDHYLRAYSYQKLLQ